MFSLRQVSKRLGVAYGRISYAHASGSVREPMSRFAGKRLYTEADVTALAQHFGVQPGPEPDKGVQCASSDTQE
jgi:DNA-binding transcriptional MerR regulator